MRKNFISKLAIATIVVSALISTVVEAKTYNYDSLGRITDVTYDNGQKTSYTYDASGNLLTVNTTTASAVNVTTGSAVNVTTGSAVTVTGVVLNKQSTNIKVGNTEKIVATVSPNNATNKNVTWSSSNNSIATVDQSGKITVVSAGTATITVTTIDGKKTASCIATVSGSTVLVTGVTLSKTTDMLKVGGTDGLSATVAPTNATNKNITWNTSNSKVATVDQNGKVTAVGAGTTTITVTTVDGSKTASCTVTVSGSTVPVTGVTLNKATDMLKVGVTDGLSATVAPTNATNKNITWNTSNRKVATVDQNGKVTAVGAGTVTITVITADGNKTANCSVAVTNTLTLTASCTNLYKTASFDVPLIDTKYGKQATLSSNQIVTVVGQNEDWYNIKTWLGDAWINLKNPTGIIYVTGISLNRTSDILKVGGTDALTATVAPSKVTNKSVTWKSSNTSVATVDSTGKVTGVGAGSATITCTASDGSGKYATCAVVVTNPVSVTSVALNKTSLSVIKGQIGTLIAGIVPITATNPAVKWKSSNAAVATVDLTGRVTGVAAGSATITCTASDGSGKSATCVITVK